VPLRRLALVSLHTSPLEVPGSGDAGGMNVYLLALADAFAADGIDVEVLTRANRPGDHGRIERTAGGALVRYLTAGADETLAKESLPRIVPAFSSAMDALPPFDVVHSHYWLSGAAAEPVARAWGAPHVQSLHTVAALKNARLAPGDRPEPRARLDGERNLVRDSAATVAATESERSAILEAYEAESDRVVVIPPGVDTRVFRPGPQAAGRPYLLVVGRIQPLKAQDLAIRALSRIPASERPLLVIAGGTSGANSDYRTDLDTLVADRGLAADVHFEGPMARDELGALMRGAQAVMVPSHSETYGLVTLEAAASGVPVIAAATSGLVDSVRDGVTGILVNSRDEADWAVAVRSLLGDTSRLAALRESAAAYGAAHTWADAAAAHLELYRALLVPNSFDWVESQEGMDR
jgi:D-inositol-3-phosphate glycosyltransferase